MAHHSHNSLWLIEADLDGFCQASLITWRDEVPCQAIVEELPWCIWTIGHHYGSPACHDLSKYEPEALEAGWEHQVACAPENRTGSLARAP